MAVGTSIDDNIELDEIDVIPEKGISQEEINITLGRNSLVEQRMLARLKKLSGLIGGGTDPNNYGTFVWVEHTFELLYKASATPSPTTFIDSTCVGMYGLMEVSPIEAIMWIKASIFCTANPTYTEPGGDHAIDDAFVYLKLPKNFTGLVEEICGTLSCGLVDTVTTPTIFYNFLPVLPATAGPLFKDKLKLQASHDLVLTNLYPSNFRAGSELHVDATFKVEITPSYVVAIPPDPIVGGPLMAMVLSAAGVYDVFTSDDEGETWSEWGFFPSTGFAGMAVDPIDGVIFAVGVSGSGWKSVDGGRTWQPTTALPTVVGGGSINWGHVICNGGRFLVANVWTVQGTNPYIVVTDDDGTVWTTTMISTSGGGQQPRQQHLSVDAGGTIWASQSSNGFATTYSLSADNGSTWAASVGPFSAVGVQTWMHFLHGASQTNAVRIASGGVQSWWRDGGFGIGWVDTGLNVTGCTMASQVKHGACYNPVSQKFVMIGTGGWTITGDGSGAPTKYLGNLTPAALFSIIHPVPGSSRLVAMGTSKYAYSDDDGVNWTEDTLVGPSASLACQQIIDRPDINITGVKFAISGVNIIHGLASRDGSTWGKTRLHTVANAWTKIAYGGGRWVAVSETAASAAIAVSPDGITFERVAAPYGRIYDVCYGFGKFFAVTDSAGTLGRIISSVDGINWTNLNIPTSVALNTICFTGSHIVAIASAGTANACMRSSDGVNFTGHTISLATAWTACNAGNGTVVAVSTGGRVMTSTDNGATWTTRTATSLSSWNGVATDGAGNWLAIASNLTGRCMKSVDNGVTWALATTPSDATGWQGICYAQGKFMAVGSSGTILIASSVDIGVSWTNVTPPAGISIACYSVAGVP
jgi:hypothetical protein